MNINHGPDVETKMDLLAVNIFDVKIECDNLLCATISDGDYTFPLYINKLFTPPKEMLLINDAFNNNHDVFIEMAYKTNNSTVLDACALQVHDI